MKNLETKYRVREVVDDNGESSFYPEKSVTVVSVLTGGVSVGWRSVTEYSNYCTRDLETAILICKNNAKPRTIIHNVEI